MLTTTNFHHVIHDAVEKKSLDNLLDLLHMLEDREDCEYHIEGIKTFGGYPVMITYNNSDHKCYGGLVESDGNWAVHT